ncbi:MAG TPA: hypothetical protein VMO47_14415, partial [Rhodothermales bacterium]|nr:hypothetical protein [Rhodothermales bacterium]
MRPRFQFVIWFAVMAVMWIAVRPTAAQNRPLTFTDLMKFRQIKEPAISDDGRWVVFREVPDRGDGAVVARSTGSDVRYEVPLGSRPSISSDGRWVAMRLEPPFVEQEAAEEDKPKRGMAVLDLRSGETESFAEVDSFGISADARWLARLDFPIESDADTASGEDSADAKDSKPLGAQLVVRELGTGMDVEISYVRSFAFDKNAAILAYAISAADSMRDGLYLRDLSEDPKTEITLDTRPHGAYSNLTWTREADAPSGLAFVAGRADSLLGASDASVYHWDGSSVVEIARAADAPAGWVIPAKNALRWSKDRERLFFGFRPAREPDAEEQDSTGTPDPYDAEAILSKKEVDVWHWNDPRINPQQKMVWKSEQSRTYDAVHHFTSGTTVALADSVVLGSGAPENPRTMLGKASAQYFKDLSWDGEFFDLYVIDMATGEKTMVAQRLEHTSALSPGGRFMVYYRYPDWYVYDVEAQSTRNVTAGLDVPFSNEDHDYPEDP